MQEINNFTNLTRLSSFLLLDMLLLIDMTWKTHLSAKNKERKRYILGDREIDKRRVDRQNTQILNDARPNRVQTYAEGIAWSVAVACLSWTSQSETPEAQHGCTIAFALQQWHVAFSGGSSFFTNLAGLFFLLLRFFLFSFSFSLFFFFFGTRLLTLRNLRYVATRLFSWDFSWDSREYFSRENWNAFSWESHENVTRFSDEYSNFLMKTLNMEIDACTEFSWDSHETI